MQFSTRPLWIIVFAILLASIAIRVRGDQPELTAVQPPHASEQQSHDASKRAGSRPKYAVVSAQLAQFDADSDPDGWAAKVILFDKRDRIVVPKRANARFELQVRVPTHDFTGYVNANHAPVTWSEPLQFDRNGIAQVRLPLRQPLKPLVGWSADSHPAVGERQQRHRLRSDHFNRSTSGALISRVAATGLAQREGALNAIGLGHFAQLKVRVSVPTEGVFDAATAVPLRPSVLVDTRWPYQ